jgi:hypothetical protein
VNGKFTQNLPLRLVFTHADEFKLCLRERDLSAAFDNVPEYLRNKNMMFASESRSISRQTSVRDIFRSMFTPRITRIDIESVPVDVLQYICTFLTLKELTTLSYLNTEWYIIANSDEVWIHWCTRYEPTLTLDSIRNFYFEHYLDVDYGVNHNRQTSLYAESSRSEPMCKFYFKNFTRSRPQMNFLIEQFLNAVEDPQKREYIRETIVVLDQFNINETQSQLSQIFDDLSCEIVL